MPGNWITYSEGSLEAGPRPAELSLLELYGVHTLANAV